MEKLNELTAPVSHSRCDYQLVWTPNALCQPRVFHARQTLVWRLRNDRCLEQSTFHISDEADVVGFPKIGLIGSAKLATDK